MNFAVLKARTLLKPVDAFALRSSAIGARGFATALAAGESEQPNAVEKSASFSRSLDAYVILNDVFPIDRMYDVRLRFSNMTSVDDASLDGRCATLRLEDGLGTPIFNLLLTTGRISPFYSFSTFSDFAYAHARGSNSLKDWVLQYPCK